MNTRKARLNPSRSAAKVHALLLDALNVSENLKADAAKWDAEIKRLNIRIRSLEHTAVVQQMEDMRAQHEYEVRRYQAEIARLEELLRYTRRAVRPFLDDYERLTVEVERLGGNLSGTEQPQAASGPGRMPEGDLVREDPGS